LDIAVAERAEGEHGVLDVDELRECGLTSQTISIRARNGRLHCLYRGVYAVGHAGVSVKGRFLAAVKACGEGAVLSHRSAAVLWGFMDEDECLPEVTVPARSHRYPRGIRLHRPVELRDDEWLILERIRVTTPVRTIIDLAGDLNAHLLRDVLRRAIGTRRVRFQQLIRALSRVGGRPGVRKLRRVIADGVPTRSELEDIVLHLLNEGGFEEPRVNVALVLDGRRVVPDFRWPSAQVVVEADGKDWHDNPIARAADRERQRLLEAHGESVVRVTWSQAVAQPARTRGRIAAAGAPLAAGRVPQPGVG
jgi:very-short-patch-repair endonuclease